MSGLQLEKTSVPLYCRGAHGAVVVYDITCPASFSRAQFWVRELQRSVGGDAGGAPMGELPWEAISLENNHVALVGNKALEELFVHFRHRTIIPVT